MNQFNQVKSSLETALMNSRCNELKSLLKLEKKGASPSIEIRKLPKIEQKKFGEFVLQIYFFQIFHQNDLILDLGAKSFLENKSWAPKPIFCRFNPQFLTGIRKVYEGLFLNQQISFREGLKILEIEPLEEVILRHFKNAQTHPIRFSLSDLKGSSKAAIVSLFKARRIPNKDMLAFGIYLSFLYQTLSKVDVPLDVHSAFNKAAL